MPHKSKAKFQTIIDTLEEALMFNESDAYLEDPNGSGDVHLIEVEHTIEGKYSVSINELEMGSSYTMGEAYDLIKSCVESD